MSKPHTFPPVDLSFLNAKYLPGCHWSMGGAIRFGMATVQACRSLNSVLSAWKPLSCVHAEPACAWSLDWGRQRALSTPTYCHQQLALYARMGLPVCLSFDNPYIPTAALQDAFGLFLVDTLLRLNPTGRNAVAVADDRLASVLLKQWPKLPLLAHENRSTCAEGETDAAHYNALAQLYNRVVLRAEDALKPGLIGALAKKNAFDVCVNSQCLRGAKAVQREYLLLAARMRVRPYEFNYTIQRRELREKLMGRPHTPRQTQTLSYAELRQLHAAGLRHFHVQAEQYHNGLTPIWALLNRLIDPAPEHSRRVAALTYMVLSDVSGATPQLPSGMGAYVMDLPE